jgi:hypothetical protein
MFVSYVFPNVRFCLSKLGFEQCVLIIYFLKEGVLFGGLGDDENT